MNRSLLDTLADSAKSRIERLREQRDFLKTPRILKVLDSVTYLCDKYALEPYAEVNIYATEIYVTFKDLTGLKDERLVSLLESIVHLDSDGTSTADFPASFSRQYSFDWKDHDDSYRFHNRPSLKLVVTANFSDDSETCKRVIVGYKEPSNEPTPIYEIQCTDGTEPVTAT